jgi:single-stranded-DNA-specific exonuclease
MSKKKWLIHQPNVNRLDYYRSISTLPDPILHALDKLDVEDLTEFLDLGLNKLSDPYLIPNLSRACERLQLAIERGDRVVVFGDYDVDGVTASSVMLHGLRMLGANVQNFIPNRLVDGYGFTEGALEHCIRLFNPNLIVTVDCGINSIATTEAAQARGIDVIITDHHEPGEGIAPALAVVNPKLGQGPINMLAGVGVSYQLCRGLVMRLIATGAPVDLEFKIRQLLDIVAIGTIADMVPLKGDNRILAHQGLLQAANSVNLGIRALLQKLGLQGLVASQDVSFKIAPRINAVGRLGDPKEALLLFTTANPDEASSLAERLESLNTERRRIEQEVTEDVLNRLKQYFNPTEHYGLVEVGYGYHAGIVGIVAAKVMNKYNRPTIVLNVGDNGLVSGSCRSIPAFNVLEALEHLKDLLVGYGGHAFAAGVKLRVENVETFRKGFNEFAKHKLAHLDITPVLDISSVLTLKDLNWAFHNQLQQLAPFGKDNPEPIWCLQNVELRNMRWINNTHLSFSLDIPSGERLSGICFNYTGKLPVGRVDVAFTLNRNTYVKKSVNPPRQVEELQLLVSDIQPATIPVGPPTDSLVMDEWFLDTHPDAIFVYGDNTIRKGTGGAARLRHHPQAIGFITKKYPTLKDNAYYTPEEYLPVFEQEVTKLVDYLQANPTKTLYITKLGSNLANRYGIWEAIIEPNLKRCLESYSGQIKYLW